MSPKLLVACLVASLMACASASAYDVTISAGASSGGTWSANSWTPSAVHSVVSAAEVAQHLSQGSVMVKATGGDNLTVAAPVSWSANTLTLSAGGNLILSDVLTATGTGGLALQYGQNAVAASNTATYAVRAPVNLAVTGTFSTQLGSDGSATSYTVITNVGSAADAVVAPTPMTLQGMATALSGKYVLGANIDASATAAWNSSTGFTPVGAGSSSSTAFTGTLEGLGHTVDHLTTSSGSRFYQGLFGYLSAATVGDIGLTNVSIGGAGYVGSLVGYADATSLIFNIFASGTVSGIPSPLVVDTVNHNLVYTPLGGLVGESDGTIRNSYATALVANTSWVFGGGLVGIDPGTMVNCYFAGSASGPIDYLAEDPGFTISSITGRFESTGTPFGCHAAWQETSEYLGIVTYHDSVVDQHLNALSTFTADGWDISPAGGTGTTWRIYDGQTDPLLSAFLVPLSVTAVSGSRPYDGTTTALGVQYSSAPDTSLISGTVTLALPSPNAGTYTVTPAGLYSNQGGYNLIFTSGLVTITPASQAISGFTANPTNAVVGSGSVLSAVGSTSGNPVVFSSATPSTCMVYGNLVAYIATGTCTIQADQASSMNYAAAPTASMDIMVGQGSQAITNFATNPTSGTLGTSAVLTATGGASGNRVVFASTSPSVCSVSNNVAKYLATGNCTLTADQAGDAYFSAAQQVSLTIPVGGASSVSGPSQGSDTGTVTGTLSGGGASCSLQSYSFTSVTSASAAPPAGLSFPFGLFDFSTGGCTRGATQVITITYPQAVRSASYWKYGPSPDGYNCQGTACQAAHWYAMPAAQAQISGNVVTLTITDGGVGDDDLSPNGSITDPGGLAVSTTNSGAVQAPVFSAWSLLLLAYGVALLGLGARRGWFSRMNAWRALPFVVLSLTSWSARAVNVPAGTLQVSVTAAGCTDTRASAQSVWGNIVSGHIDLSGFCPNVATLEVNATVGLSAGTTYTSNAADLALSNTPSNSGSLIVSDPTNAIASIQAQLINGGGALSYVIVLYGPVNDALNALENQPLTINPATLKLNNGAFNQLLGYGSPAHGSLATDGGGNWIYTPATNYTGADTFTYTARAPSGATRSAQVNLNVQFVNQPPSFTLGADIVLANNQANTGAHVYSGWASNFLPGPSTQSSQTMSITTTVLSSSTLVFDVPPSVDVATGNLSFTAHTITKPEWGTSRLASGTAQVQVNVQNSGGTAMGGKDTTTQIFKITVDSLPVVSNISQTLLLTPEPPLPGVPGPSAVIQLVGRDTDGYQVNAELFPPPVTAHLLSVPTQGFLDPPFTQGFAPEDLNLYEQIGFYKPFSSVNSVVDSFAYTLIDQNGSESWPATVVIQMMCVSTETVSCP